jgi:hypothetical protein
MNNRERPGKGNQASGAVFMLASPNADLAVNSGIKLWG